MQLDKSAAKEVSRLVPAAKTRQQDRRTECCNVLFVCPDNSASSILAEALLKRWGGAGFRAFSAGCNPAPDVHPMTRELLEMNRITRDGLRPKSWEQYLGQESPRMRFVISLGDQKPDGMPSTWPGNPKLVHWHISEPLVDGSSAQQARAFRKTFTELETRVKLFVLVNDRPTSRMAAA